MRKFSCNLMTFVVTVFGPLSAHAFPLGDNAANWVLGQSDFVTGYVDIAIDSLFGSRPASANSMFLPYDVAYDQVDDRLFVADMHNHRVMVFNLASGIPVGKKASFVLGQNSSTKGGADLKNPFGNTNTKNVLAGCESAVNPCGMQRVYSVSYDPIHKYLFAADSDNNRILVWDLSTNLASGAPAAFVLGQQEFDTASVNQTCDALGNPSPNSCGLNKPTNVEFDPATESLYVADQGNNRILVFDLSSGIFNGMPASRVFGQPTMDRASRNTRCNGAVGPGPTNACGLSNPVSVAVDATNQRVFVGDSGNRRIVVYSTSGQPTNGVSATNVLGQANFTGSATNAGCESQANIGGAPTACGMGAFEAFATFVPPHQLFVTDTANHRVVVFDVDEISNGEAASAVMGQSDFTTGFDQNDSAFGGATTRSRMILPDGAAYDPIRDRFFIADGGNHRVLVFSSNVAGNPVIYNPLTRATSTTVNPDGSTTVNLVDARHDNFEVTFPAGTLPKPGFDIAVTVSNTVGYDRPRMRISAALPTGTTKSIRIPTGDSLFVCAMDKEINNFAVTTCALTYKYALPAPGTCTDVIATGNVGDNPDSPEDPNGLHPIQICLDENQEFITLHGLKHTDIAATDPAGNLVAWPADDAPAKTTNPELDGEGGCSTTGSSNALGSLLVAGFALLSRFKRASTKR